MANSFKRLLMAMGIVSSVAMSFLMVTVIFLTDTTAAFSVMALISGSLLCLMPFLLLGIIITGIGSLIQGALAKNTKQKREYSPYLEFGESRLDHIMKQLSPEDRAYLERRLADREVGLHDEELSIEDLFNESEQKSKRNY